MYNQRCFVCFHTDSNNNIFNMFTYIHYTYIIKKDELTLYTNSNITRILKFVFVQMIALLM